MRTRPDARATDCALARAGLRPTLGVDMLTHSATGIAAGAGHFAEGMAPRVAALLAFRCHDRLSLDHLLARRKPAGAPGTIP